MVICFVINVKMKEMKQIRKYEIHHVLQEQKLKFNKDCIVLKFAMQGDYFRIWVLEETEVNTSSVHKSFMIFPTGAFVESEWSYFDTVMHDASKTVWHLFERSENGV